LGKEPDRCFGRVVIESANRGYNREARYTSSSSTSLSLSLSSTSTGALFFVDALLQCFVAAVVLFFLVFSHIENASVSSRFFSARYICILNLCFWCCRSFFPGNFDAVCAPLLCLVLSSFLGSLSLSLSSGTASRYRRFFYSLPGDRAARD
jgi:hypothetical protein